MKKKNNFIIPLVVYPFDIMVSINETDDQLKSNFLKYQIEYGDYFSILNRRAHTLQFEEGQTVMRFIKAEYADLATVSHEIFHAVTLILDRVGLKFDIDKNDEAYAYLIGYITQEFYSNWK